MIKLFGLGGKKEPEKGPKMGKGFVPTDKVKELSGRGFSEPEIVDALRKEGFDIKILTVPSGKDPDEFIKKYGRDEFLKIIDRAEPLLNYKLQKAK